uniref:Scaffold attachment factor B1 n=1 Tax=Elaeophora elaphi TaxID=1147741 RepID=A0A0R3S161_9BILA
MATTPVAASQGKTMTLSELRVFELKQELEKRGLDKSGIKLALVERLEEALREEGHDPKIYKFAINDYGKFPAIPSKSAASETTKENQFGSSSHETLSEHGLEVSNGRHENNLQEIKKEDPSESDTAIGVVIESEDSDETVEKSDLATTKELSKEVMEGKKVKHNQVEGTSVLKQEDRNRTELIQEQMEVNEVIEDNSIVKEIVETKEPEEEETVKEIADEVNYEDEEMPDTTRINEEEGEAEECKETESKMMEKEDESKAAGKSEVKASKEGDNSFTSTVETVASTPVERMDGAPHAATSVLKKSDNSLWIKGISPNTKAADLKALFAKYGRVLTAKIFTRRQQPSNACFGFVTMVDSAAADLCIQKLHKTNVKGRPITVERADRCNMPIVKSIPKKPTSNATTDVKSGKSTSTFDTCSKSGEEKLSTSRAVEKSKKDISSTDKSKSNTSSGSKAVSTTRNEKQKTVKAISETKKSPVKAPSASTTHSRFSTLSSSKRSTVTRVPSRFRASRRIERTDRVSSTLRRSYVIRKPSYSSAASRRTLGSRPFSSRLGRGSILRGMVRREVSSRRVEPPTSWEKREMMEMLRKKEEEHRLKEQELRLQRERERLKFERERFERERLELQQLRQIAALTTPVQMMSAPGAPPPRRSHEYGDMDSSRYKSEKELKRSEYSRRSGERSSSHREVTSTRNSLPDRREAHSSSRHVSSTHSSSRAVERSRERSRDRSRHSTRDYGSSNVVRESVPSYGRESHSYSRSGDPTISNSYGRDPYRPDSTTYSNHRSGDAGYGSRDLGTYSSSSTYSRDVAPSSYSKDSGYGASSRSLGNSASWSVGGSSSTYVGSSRDYDGDAWISGVSASQSHGNHGLGSSNWSSSRDDHWSGGGIADTHGHVSTYDKYDKYDSYDKYNRRY